MVEKGEITIEGITLIKSKVFEDERGSIFRNL